MRLLSYWAAHFRKHAVLSVLLGLLAWLPLRRENLTAHLLGHNLALVQQIQALGRFKNNRDL